MRNLVQYPITFKETIAELERLEGLAERRVKREGIMGDTRPLCLRFAIDRLVRLQFAASEEY